MDWVKCSECEEQYNCPNASRRDGCELGLKTPTEEEEDENE